MTLRVPYITPFMRDPCHYYIQHKMIWDGLVELAHKVADKLNQEEADATK